MTFEYKKEIMPLTRDVDGVREWDGDAVETISFEPSEKDLRRALVYVIMSVYFEKLAIKETAELRKGLKVFVDDLDLEDKEIERLYYNDLKEFFKDEALGECA